jgi:hypothetical protein
VVSVQAAAIVLRWGENSPVKAAYDQEGEVVLAPVVAMRSGLAAIIDPAGRIVLVPAVAVRSGLAAASDLAGTIGLVLAGVISVKLVTTLVS